MKTDMPEPLHDVPRMGWVDEATPVMPVHDVVDGTGCSSLFVKRDDRLDALHGGTKPRKLDYLLANSPFSDAEGWHSMGGIGSGHLVALTAAALELDRDFHAHCFWQPVSDPVIENLGYTSSYATSFSAYGSRLSMVLRRPGLFLRSDIGGWAVIPPGGTTRVSMLGLVRAGLELAGQVRDGELPEPERLYVALGTGGTAVGLAVGLGLAGLDTTVHAVATVEHPICTRRRLHSLRDDLVDWLAVRGLDVTPAAIEIDRRELGRGYGADTSAGRAARKAAAAHGVDLCPTYTSKAFSALLRDASDETFGPTVFWLTGHSDSLPHADNWRDRLPDSFARKLDNDPGPRIGRRRLIVGGLAAATAVGVAGTLRFAAYDTTGVSAGSVLSAREAVIVRAAAEALLHRGPTAEQLDEVVDGVDRFLSTMPEFITDEVHTMLTFVEQATPLRLYLRRASSLDRDSREAYLAGLAEAGGLLSQAYRGLRDLCLVGYYQRTSSWDALGYGGPMVSGERERATRYQALCAPDGALPSGATT